MNSRWRSESGGEINLAPLLDVIFTLLFFFVVATSIREERRAVDVELPRTGQETASIADARALEVQVTEENAILFEGRPVSPGGLVEALREAPREGVAKVVIRSAGGADVQVLYDATDACEEAGFRDIAWEVQPRTTGGPAEEPVP